jgi:hypothetical protein
MIARRLYPDRVASAIGKSFVWRERPRPRDSFQMEVIQR